jgi:hypothetical protein
VGTVRARQIGGDSKKGIEHMDRTDKIVVALSAALAACAIGGGVGIANATPAPAPAPPPPPATSVVDPPEPGDTPDVAGAQDGDNIQEGDQNGPEVPDTTVTPAPPGR